MGLSATAMKEAIDNPQSWAANRTPKWLLTNFSSTRLVTKKQHIYQSLTLAESVRSAIDSQQIVPILTIQLQQLPQFQQLDWHKQEEILDRLLILRRDRHICHQMHIYSKETIMLKLQFSTLINTYIRDQIAKRQHLPFGMKTGRHYVDKYSQREVNHDRIQESRWIPPYDDPLY